ncbi:MAG: sulfatase, partial [Pyrinomonadaceae bacterium]
TTDAGSVGAPLTSGPGARFLILAAVWCGLLAGLVEVAVRATQKFYLGQAVGAGPDFFWMTPLANTVVLLAAGLALAAAARLRPTLVSARLAVFVFSLPVFLNLLLMYPRLQHYAAALLATGLAVQSARLAATRQRGFRQLVGRSLPLMLLLVVLLAATAAGWRWTAERRALAQLPAAPAGAPNVLFITLDTVRAQNLSLYGYGRETSPRLNQLAARGVTFERALSTAPWTLPSHASMFTGRFPHEMNADWDRALGDEHPTLAEAFAARGYLTAGFVANTGYCSHEHGLDRGFAHYEDFPRSLGQLASSSTLVRTVADHFRVRRLVRNDEHLNRQPADRINDRFLRWLAGREEGRPFFAFLNYYDAHDPYLPPAPYDRKFGPGRAEGKHSPLHHFVWDPAARNRKLSPQEVRTEIDAYDGAISYLDHQLGLLFDELGRRGLLENTLVVVTSDHGEEFGEHGGAYHGTSLYEEQVRVPLRIAIVAG